MAYTGRIYLAFDAQNDSRFAVMMRHWLQEDGSTYDWDDSWELKRNLSNENSLRDQIRSRMDVADVFVLLAGENTRYPFKFLEWEMEFALELRKPIVVVNLNGTRFRDDMCCPLLLQDKMALHISYIQAIFNYAIRNWPERYRELLAKGEVASYYYSPEVYKRFNV